MNIGVVGAEGAKFTALTERHAKVLILHLLQPPEAVLVSGGCHLGGVDIWAEEIAGALGRGTIIHRPAAHSWSAGYRPRNLQIAQDSHALHNIVVAEYPPRYKGMRFAICYHCARRARE